MQYYRMQIFNRKFPRMKLKKSFSGFLEKRKKRKLTGVATIVAKILRDNHPFGKNSD